MFKVFTKCVHKLKQCTNLRLHDANYNAKVVRCLITCSQNGGRRRGAHLREGGGASFEFWLIGRALIQGGANSKI